VASAVSIPASTFSGWTEASGWKSRDWEFIAGAGAGPIMTEEKFSGDIGFIVDLKRHEDSGTPRLLVRGKEIPLAPTDPHWEKTGSYNRIEGFLRGSELRLEVNGKDAGTFPEIPAEGPLGIIPDGPSDWANPYVRSLPAE